MQHTQSDATATWRVAYRVWDAQLLEFVDGLSYVPLLDVFGGLDLETTGRRKAFRRRPAPVSTCFSDYFSVYSL